MQETKIINAFPGYEFKLLDDGKYHNIYRGTDIGKGGYIRSKPGIYINVALLDIASLHPNSIRAMNCFGEHTKNFTDILDARIAIKHKDYDAARKMFDGRLSKYLDDESTAKDLAQALKIAINSVYGLTSANFQNPFRDVRNKNNIVALRGALFMRTLQDEVENRGFEIVAIKTDSIKIANATKEIVDFCMEFANKYGYTFEHEATYDRICQINDADYIARYKDPEWCKETYGYIPGNNVKEGGKWTVTGKQFARPYVFKTLFSKEQIKPEDLCEVFEVKSALYLDMNEKLPQLTPEEEKKLDVIDKAWHSLAGGRPLEEVAAKYGYTYEEIGEVYSKLCEKEKAAHDYRFIGKVGEFCPIKPGKGGGILLRKQDDKYYAAPGTTGYRWLESEQVLKSTGETTSVIDPETGEKKILAKKAEISGLKDIIDESYYKKLVNDAIDSISKYRDFYWFVSDEPAESMPIKIPTDFMNIPENADEEKGVPWDEADKVSA